VKVVYIADLAQHVGEEVTVRGWLKDKTDKGKLYFLMVRDGTGVVQAVAFQPEVSAETFAACQQVTQESSLIVTGTVRAVMSCHSRTCRSCSAPRITPSPPRSMAWAS
jgi:asparaginyl-tRNA synthetase